MQNLNLKSVAFILFASAFLAGCSSSDTDATGDANQSGVGSGSSTSGLGDRSGLDDGSSMGGRNGNVIYFEFDKADITAESEALLDKHAARLKSSSAHAVLEGHCDERGTREYNMALGEHRSKSVASYLTTQGVSPSQLESVSYGEERPAVEGHDESAWSLNRRVEIVNR